MSSSPSFRVSHHYSEDVDDLEEVPFDEREESTVVTTTTKTTSPERTTEELTPTSYYRVDTGAKGRGLFAIRDIAPQTLIHVAPCILIAQEEYETHMKHTILETYLFNASGGNKLLALGDGSLFNHSQNPNIDYRVDSDSLCIRYMAGHQAILMGQELCITYGDKLWFDDADANKDGDVDEQVSQDDGTAEDDESPQQEDDISDFLANLEL